MKPTLEQLNAGLDFRKPPSPKEEPVDDLRFVYMALMDRLLRYGVKHHEVDGKSWDDTFALLEKKAQNAMPTPTSYKNEPDHVLVKELEARGYTIQADYNALDWLALNGMR